MKGSHINGVCKFSDRLVPAFGRTSTRRDQSIWRVDIRHFVPGDLHGDGLCCNTILPGDSLLFAAGTFAALGSLNIWYLVGLLMLAAILGDTANYSIGHYLGERAYNIKWIKKEYFDKTHAFFEKHGGQAIFLARFVPIVRTFAPFVAGIGKMPYTYFITYNFVGGIAWVALFTLAGFYFGNIPWVKKNFEFVIIAIILISVMPMAYEWWQARREAKAAK